jgi:hypothetical protein
MTKNALHSARCKKISCKEILLKISLAAVLLALPDIFQHCFNT